MLQELWYTFKTHFSDTVSVSANLPDYNLLTSSRGVPVAFAHAFSEMVAKIRRRAAHAAATSPMPGGVPGSRERLSSSASGGMGMNRGGAGAGSSAGLRRNAVRPLSFKLDRSKPDYFSLDPNLSVLGDMSVRNVSWILERLNIKIKVVPEYTYTSLVAPFLHALSALKVASLKLDNVFQIHDTFYPVDGEGLPPDALDARFGPTVSEALGEHQLDAGAAKDDAAGKSSRSRSNARDRDAEDGFPSMGSRTLRSVSSHKHLL